MIDIREPRRQVRLLAQLRGGDDWRRVAITNVSIAGLRCQCPDPPAVGETVEIRYQGFCLVGLAQWCDGDEFGVTCDNTVDVEMLVSGSPEVDIGRRALPRLEVRFPARFVGDERAFPVVVLDVSPGGARLAMASPAERGQRGILHWDGIEAECTVVWSGDGAFGVIFGNELPAGPQPAIRRDVAETRESDANEAHDAAHASLPAARAELTDRRSNGRTSVNWTCEVHHAESRRARVTVGNISTTGCVIGWFAGCRTDHPLYIKLRDLGAVQAHVVWKNDRRIGCRFSRPLNSWVLQHLLAEQFV